MQTAIHRALPHGAPWLTAAILVCALLPLPRLASGQPPGAGGLAGMKHFDQLLVTADLAQSAPLRALASRPSGIVFESPERVHIVFGGDPAAPRQRAILNLITKDVTWFPVAAPLTAAPPDPLPRTSWSRDHALLLETPQGQRELYRSDCADAQVFVRRQGMVVVFGCGRFAVVDLEGRELLTDRFSTSAPVPLAFSRDGQLLRVTLRQAQPGVTAAPAAIAIVEYRISSGKRSNAVAVPCRQADLCVLSDDGSMVVTVSDEGLVQVYSDSTDRLTRTTSSGGLSGLATIRSWVTHGNDPVPHAVVRFQSVLRQELNLQFETDSSGRSYVDTIPNSLYCVAAIVDGIVSRGDLVDIHFPDGINGNASWRPLTPGTSGTIQQKACDDAMAGKATPFLGKTRIRGTVRDLSPDRPHGRKACFQNIALPDLRFEFDIGDDGQFSGEVPEGFYRLWLGAPAAPPSFSRVSALAGPVLMVTMGEHAPETEAKIWGELKNGSGQTVCLRSEQVQKCMETSRLGQYGFRLPLGSYDASISRAGKIVWTGKLVLSEPGEYRDPIRLP